jgi:hypothetical protein
MALVVRTYGGPKIDPSALPGARKSAAETFDSEGGGLALAQAGKDEAIAGLGAQAARIGTAAAGQMIQRARDEADQTALLDASNQLSAAENKLLYDPDTGALTVKGKAAMGLPESVGGEFDSTASTIAAGLTTRRQQEAFARLRSERTQNLDLTLRRHVAGEMQSYADGEAQGAVTNATNAALANAQDPARVGLELSNATTAAEQSARIRGLGPEETKHVTDAVRSNIHVGVIENLLTADKAKAAQVYFEETKDQISGAALAHVQAALEEGTLRGAAQQQADTIVADGGTVTEQLAKARQIDDPKLRDAVQERIEHQASIDQAAKRQADETNLSRAYQIVDQTADVNKIPAALWASIPGEHLGGLRAYAAALAKGEKPTTDAVTYYSLMNQAGNDPTEFSKANLLGARNRLDDADFKQLVDIQLAIRKGDREKADHDLAGFRTRSQILDDSLAAYGFDMKDAEKNPTSDKAKAIGELRRLVDDEVARAQAPTRNADGTITPGKKVDDKGVQLIIDKLLSKQTGSAGSWWNLIPGAGWVNGRSWLSGIGDTTKPLIQTTTSDISKADRASIEAALKAAGRPVSDATVLDLYIRTKARIGGK